MSDWLTPFRRLFLFNRTLLYSNQIIRGTRGPISGFPARTDQRTYVLHVDVVVLETTYSGVGITLATGPYWASLAKWAVAAAGVWPIET